MQLLYGFLIAVVISLLAYRAHSLNKSGAFAAAVMGTTAIVGVELGVLAAKALPEQTLRRLFGILVLAVAAQLAWRARRSILAP